MRLNILIVGVIILGLMWTNPTTPRFEQWVIKQETQTGQDTKLFDLHDVRRKSYMFFSIHELSIIREHNDDYTGAVSYSGVGILGIFFPTSTPTNDGKQAPLFKDRNKLKSEDRALIENLVELEAHDEPYITQVAIAAVVFNRMKLNDFSGSVPDVIMQLNAAAMEKVAVSSESSKRAVEDAWNGMDPGGGSTRYFKTDQEAIDSKMNVIKKIGSITFCI